MWSEPYGLPYDRTPTSSYLYLDESVTPSAPEPQVTRIKANKNISQDQGFNARIDHLERFRRRYNIFSHRIKERRLVSKNGTCIIASRRNKRKLFRLDNFRDIFTTLVDMPWYLNIFIFICTFFMTWLVYACLWWIICYYHGDLTKRPENSSFIPCVTNVYSFTSAFIFSVESQLTIGYGRRYLTEECFSAILNLCLQSITGIIMQSFMVGVVFAKLSQPQKRTGHLIFSKNAVVCIRDGVYCLLFRVADLRKSQLIGATVRAHLLKQRITQEGEVIPLFINDINLGFNTGEERLLLLIPVTICHVIDQTSPFWEMSAHDLTTVKFELIVILEGTVESTGVTLQARTSYLPAEIIWGCCPHNVITFEEKEEQYDIHLRFFDEVTLVRMPKCSAREYSNNRELYSLDCTGS